MGEALLLPSRIDRVTLYRRGALVTRVVEVPTDGPGEVALGPLPLAVVDESVRVEAKGGRRANEVAVRLTVPPPDAALLPARPEDLEAADLLVWQLDDAREQVEQELARTARLGVVRRPEPRPGREPAAAPREARLALLALREERLAELDAEHARLQVALREASARLADLRERERRATSARRTEAHEVRKQVCIVLGEGEGATRLEVTYRVDAARWAPSYVLRLAPDLSRATLEVRAMVAQRTGEDWDAVTLALSTASLEGWAELPKLASQRIGRRADAVAQVGWRPPPTGAEELFVDYDRAAAAIARARPVAKAAPTASVPYGAPAAAALEEARRDAPAPPPRPMPVGAPMPSAAPEMPAGAPMASAAPVMQAGAPAPPGAPMQSFAAMPAMAPPQSRAAAPKGGVPLLGAMARSVSAAFDAGGLRGGGGADPSSMMQAELLSAEAPASAGGFEVGVEHLRYEQLRVLPPTDGQRGKLLFRGPGAVSREDVGPDVDLRQAYALLEQRGRALFEAALPPGCVAPSPSGYDFLYPAEGRLTAPSDGAFHSMPIAHHEADARARFVVVPRESRDAFRFVELESPLDAPLLAGPVDVYVGEDFLLGSQLEEVPPGGVARLGLGVEQRLKVARNARFREKSGGLMGGRLDLEHELDIEVQNQLPRSAELEVRERIPVTREGEDDIAVRDVAAEPAWEEWRPAEDEALKGGHRWQLTVGPGEKRTLRARYTVRIASKHELVGGNRRER